MRGYFNNTLLLTGKAVRVFLNYPHLLVFPILGALSVFGLVSVYYLCLYYQYGIHVFNADTFANISQISLIQFGVWNIVLLLLLFFIGGVIFIYLEYAMCYMLLAAMRGHSVSFFRAIYRAIVAIHAVGHLALLLTIINIKMVFDLEFLHVLLEHIIRILSTRRIIPDNELAKFHNYIFLSLPIMVDKKIDVREALHTSIDLIKEKVGSAFSFNIAFGYFFISMLIIPTYFAAHYFTVHHNQLAAMSIFLLMIGIWLLISDMVELVFQTATYLYCINQPTGPFTQEDFTASFVTIEKGT